MLLFDDETGSDNFLEMRRDFGKITQAFFIPKDGKYFKEDVYLRESRPQESFLNLFVIHDTPTNEQFKALSAYLNNGSEVATGTDPNNPNELSADWLAKNWKSLREWAIKSLFVHKRSKKAEARKIGLRPEIRDPLKKIIGTRHLQLIEWEKEHPITQESLNDSVLSGFIDDKDYPVIVGKSVRLSVFSSTSKFSTSIHVVSAIDLFEKIFPKDKLDKHPFLVKTEGQPDHRLGNSVLATNPKFAEHRKKMGLEGKSAQDAASETEFEVEVDFLTQELPNKPSEGDLFHCYRRKFEEGKDNKMLFSRVIGNKFPSSQSHICPIHEDNDPSKKKIGEKYFGGFYIHLIKTKGPKELVELIWTLLGDRHSRLRENLILSYWSKSNAFSKLPSTKKRFAPIINSEGAIIDEFPAPSKENLLLAQRNLRKLKERREQILKQGKSEYSKLLAKEEKLEREKQELQELLKKNPQQLFELLKPQLVVYRDPSFNQPTGQTPEGEEPTPRIAKKPYQFYQQLNEQIETLVEALKLEHYENYPATYSRFPLEAGSLPLLEGLSVSKEGIEMLNQTWNNLQTVIIQPYTEIQKWLQENFYRHPEFQEAQQANEELKFSDWFQQTFLQTEANEARAQEVFVRFNQLNQLVVITEKDTKYQQSLQDCDLLFGVGSVLGKFPGKNDTSEEFKKTLELWKASPWKAPHKLNDLLKQEPYPLLFVGNVNVDDNQKEFLNFAFEQEKKKADTDPSKVKTKWKDFTTWFFAQTEVQSAVALMAYFRLNKHSEISQAEREKVNKDLVASWFSQAQTLLPADWQEQSALGSEFARVTSGYSSQAQALGFDSRNSKQLLKAFEWKEALKPVTRYANVEDLKTLVSSAQNDQELLQGKAWVEYLQANDPETVIQGIYQRDLEQEGVNSENLSQQTSEKLDQVQKKLGELKQLNLASPEQLELLSQITQHLAQAQPAPALPTSQEEEKSEPDSAGLPETSDQATPQSTSTSQSEKSQGSWISRNWMWLLGGGLLVTVALAALTYYLGWWGQGTNPTGEEGENESGDSAPDLTLPEKGK